MKSYDPERVNPHGKTIYCSVFLEVVFPCLTLYMWILSIHCPIRIQEIPQQSKKNWWYLLFLVISIHTIKGNLIFSRNKSVPCFQTLLDPYETVASAFIQTTITLTSKRSWVDICFNLNLQWIWGTLKPQNTYTTVIQLHPHCTMINRCFSKS